MKILINAYACSPHMGSEPGMAWNWILHLSAHCDLVVITEGEYKDKIESNKQGNYKKLSTILYNPDELKCTKYDLIKHIQNNKIY